MMLGYKKFLEMLVSNPRIVQIGRQFFGSKVVNRNYLYGKANQWMARKLDSKSPYGNLRLNIETTLACNAQCVMCTKNSMPLKVGTMSMDLFKKIIDEASEVGVKKMILSVYGEPMLDSHFFERADLVEKAGIRFSFFTNGSLLTEEKAEKLLSYKNFHRINFSVSAYNPELYEKIMVGLNREKTYNNIKRFLELKQRHRPDVKAVVTGVVFDWNEHEARQLEEYWNSQPGVKMVYLMRIRTRGGTVLDIQQKDSNIHFSPLAQKGSALHPCHFLWDDLFIYWDGTVGPCCEDTVARRIIIGDISKETLPEIWTGKKMTALRKQHLEGKRSRHPVCGKQCSFNTIWLKPSG